MPEPPGALVLAAMNPCHKWLLPLLLTSLAAAVGAQGAATKSIGAARSGGKLLTREELRTCINQQKDLAMRKPALESERAGLDRERDELQKIDESLKAEQAAMEKLTQAAADINRRSKELQQQTADYNDRAAKFQNAGLSGPTAERQRRSLENEKASLDKAAQALEADRASFGNAEQMTKTYTARAETRNQAAADWNARNAKLTKTTQDYQIDLQNWQSDCEGRSYREDDEKAILSGK